MNLYIINLNMLRKLAIIVFTAILLSVNANAGSDGELALKKKLI